MFFYFLWINFLFGQSFNETEMLVSCRKTAEAVLNDFFRIEKLKEGEDNYEPIKVKIDRLRKVMPKNGELKNIYKKILQYAEAIRGITNGKAHFGYQETIMEKFVAITSVLQLSYFLLVYVEYRDKLSDTDCVLENVETKTQKKAPQSNNVPKSVSTSSLRDNTNTKPPFRNNSLVTGKVAEKKIKPNQQSIKKTPKESFTPVSQKKFVWQYAKDNDWINFSEKVCNKIEETRGLVEIEDNKQWIQINSAHSKVNIGDFEAPIRRVRTKNSSKKKSRVYSWQYKDNEKWNDFDSEISKVINTNIEENLLRFDVIMFDNNFHFYVKENYVLINNLKFYIRKVKTDNLDLIKNTQIPNYVNSSSPTHFWSIFFCSCYYIFEEDISFAFEKQFLSNTFQFQMSFNDISMDLDLANFKAVVCGKEYALTRFSREKYDPKSYSVFSLNFFQNENQNSPLEQKPVNTPEEPQILNNDHVEPNNIKIEEQISNNKTEEQISNNKTEKQISNNKTEKQISKNKTEEQISKNKTEKRHKQEQEILEINEPISTPVSSNLGSQTFCTWQYTSEGGWKDFSPYISEVLSSNLEKKNFSFNLKVGNINFSFDLERYCFHIGEVLSWIRVSNPSQLKSSSHSSNFLQLDDDENEEHSDEEIIN